MEKAILTLLLKKKSIANAVVAYKLFSRSIHAYMPLSLQRVKSEVNGCFDGKFPIGSYIWLLLVTSV